jgi:hypothetical protein
MGMRKKKNNDTWGPLSVYPVRIVDFPGVTNSFKVQFRPGFTNDSDLEFRVYFAEPLKFRV